MLKELTGETGVGGGSGRFLKEKKKTKTQFSSLPSLSPSLYVVFLCAYICRYTYTCGNMYVEGTLGVLSQIPPLMFFFRRDLTGLEFIQ